jgi:hypothetical protein
MPPLYNAYEAKLLNVLHSKLCKEDKRKMISLYWATCPFWRKMVYFQEWPAHTLILVYFHGRLTHTYSKWSFFRGDLLTHAHNGLFSRETNPHILKVVYFHGRPAHTLTLVYFQGRPTHTYSKWSIFTGDLPTHLHWSIFTGDLPTHTHFGLFSRATSPFDWVYLRSYLVI